MADSSHYVGRSILDYDADDQPTHPLQRLESTNVLDVLEALDAPRLAAADVERGALWCGDFQFADGNCLTVEQHVAPGLYAPRRVRIGVDQFDADVVVKPLAAV